MELLTLVLLLAIAVLVSAVIDRVVPRVSLPLIQVAMGVIIALFARGTIDINLEPDVFLVLFIAPLLYLEAKDADKALLWRNKKPILSLAIGLVIVTTLIIGFVLNAIVPSISLAAAFALGAALGPTDAVAVTSLSKQVSIPERLWGILKGELLLNDASGIVSFQFAIAAAATGTFSLLDASADFVIEFIGGLIFGAVLGYAANWILRRIRDIGIESTTFHVLYEICIPFVVYLFADAIHVSGIIAVVVAGLVNVIAPRTTSPNIAHMNIVSSSVWDVISFTLNGIVFVLLGTQIPTAMLYTWQDNTISNGMLILLILLTTATLLLVRFVWCTVMEYVHTRSEGERFNKHSFKNALLITLCGAKGTITLSILFTIPIFMSTGTRFPERNLILFIGCGVILCTLLIATFIVPLVAPKRESKKSEIEARENYFECLADIHRNVIEELASNQKPTNSRATRAVIKMYQNRISDTKEFMDWDDEPNIKLRIQTLEWEREHAEKLIEEGKVDRDVGHEYIGRLEKIEGIIDHGGRKLSLRRVISALRHIIFLARSLFLKLVPDSRIPDRAVEMRNLQRETTAFVIDKLHDAVASSQVPTEDASKLLLDYERTLSNLRSNATSVTTQFQIADDVDDIKRLAYQLELEQIQKMYEQDRISRQEARNMRDNVFLMQMDLEDKL